MISFIGKIMHKILFKSGNRNPERNKSSHPGLRKLSILFWRTPNRDLTYKVGKTKNGTRYEIYLPKENVHPEHAVYYLHGGGYVGKQHWLYRYQSRYFSKAAGNASVIYLDYDVAPKHVYPTQLNQALDLWEEITGSFGFSPENVVLGGDSAGGNLLLALILKLRDEGKPLPRGGFLISPWTDMLASGPSYAENYQKDAVFGHRKKAFTEHSRKKLLDFDLYCWAEGADRTDPYVSPVYADFHDFPPLYFTVGCNEMMRSDTELVVEKLRKSNVPVGIFRGNGMWHAFTLYHGIVPEAVAAFSCILNFISDLFQTYDYVYPDKDYLLS